MRRPIQNASRTEKVIARLVTTLAAMIVGQIARVAAPEKSSVRVLMTAATPSAKTIDQAWLIHHGPTCGAPWCSQARHDRRSISRVFIRRSLRTAEKFGRGCDGSTAGPTSGI